MTTALIEPVGLLARRQSFVVTSVTRRQANDITRQVRECVLETGVLNGMVLANVLHTTSEVLQTAASRANLKMSGTRSKARRPRAKRATR